MNTELIKPRLLKGFRDSLPYGPLGEKRRRKIINSLSELFELAGFDPIDTPALELCEILLGKAGGETEKQIYRFQDNGGRDVALRFDLTVPFSRFVVQHAQALDFPFKRYHIAKVWRGENAQQGRYREFYQCDFDIVGASSNSTHNILEDLCILQTAHSALNHLQQHYPTLGPICIHINHRGLLETFWQLCNISTKQQAKALTAIDRLYKAGRIAVRQELESIVNAEMADALMLYLDITNSGPKQINQSFIPQLKDVFFRMENKIYRSRTNRHTATHYPKTLNLEQTLDRHLDELQQIIRFATESGISMRFDPSIVRGLDYYTGMVFETFLEYLPGLGSICSGGRYDQLTQLYQKKVMPGVGGSIGLDRLLAGLAQLEEQSSKANSTPPNIPISLIISPDPNLKDQQQSSNIEYHLACLQMNQELQDAGIICDLVPSANKMGILFQRAECKHSSHLLLLQSDFCWQLRNLATRTNTKVSSVSEILLQLKKTADSLR